MGQYHYVVNLTKKEFLHPHKLGDGLKLWEQLNSTGGTMAALFLLLACSNGRGGGDIRPQDPELQAIVDEMVGRWAGDEIAVVGDYAEDTDLRLQHRAESIYRRCSNGEFKDISDDILPVVEFACGVKITGEGWRRKEGGFAALRPDMVITL